MALNFTDVVFILLINVNANNCWHFNICEQDKFLCLAELSMEKVF